MYAKCSNANFGPWISIDPNALNAEADIERKRGMARASLGLYTTDDDLQALVEAIKDLIARKEEIHASYHPVGSNGYQHNDFAPDTASIFNPLVALESALK